MSTQFYDTGIDFPLESGETIINLRIAYHTFGTLSRGKDNVIWVCHALTANSDVKDWWPNTVEKEKFLDPSRYFIVCANIIGSHYGTTGPLSIDPKTGSPYYSRFPSYTIRDIVNMHMLLADHLGIGTIHALVGSSVGGFQAIEWAIMEPKRFRKLILCATAERATPWAIALDETQRMAIEADPTYGEDRDDAGMMGMAAARAIGLLSYRGPKGYNLTQNDPEGHEGPHRACTYQRHQGDKICRRYNAYSYHVILDAFDTHDVGRQRGGIPAALSAIKADTLVVAITTDIIFPTDEMKALANMIPGSVYDEIESEFGHDGFLVEHERLNEILKPFIDGETEPLAVKGEKS